MTSGFYQVDQQYQWQSSCYFRFVIEEISNINDKAQVTSGLPSTGDQQYQWQTGLPSIGDQQYQWQTGLPSIGDQQYQWQTGLPSIGDQQYQWQTGLPSIGDQQYQWQTGLPSIGDQQYQWQTGLPSLGDQQYQWHNSGDFRFFIEEISNINDKAQLTSGFSSRKSAILLLMTKLRLLPVFHQ